MSPSTPTYLPSTYIQQGSASHTAEGRGGDLIMLTLRHALSLTPTPPPHPRASAMIHAGLSLPRSFLLHRSCGRTSLCPKQRTQKPPHCHRSPARANSTSVGHLFPPGAEDLTGGNRANNPAPARRDKQRKRGRERERSGCPTTGHPEDGTHIHAGG